ncbi:MAG: serine protease [Alcanivorax sp.]|nr:serine protease [Alcanivorax sp.]
MNRFRAHVLRWQGRFGVAGVACILLGALLSIVSVAQDSRNSAYLLDIDGPIGPATSDYVLRGMQQAREGNAEVIILRMDTPGGLDSAMRQMIKEILSSPIPVVGYVGPSGSRAASAGTYLLYASHLAAMAPSTNLGSATPVQMGGMPGAPDEPAEAPRQEERGSAEENGDEADLTDRVRRGSTAMERKVLEDAVAYIRGLAELRGRNADWAEEAVREAVNLTSSQALEKNVINVVAEDIDDLLAQIHGKEVRMERGTYTLNTENLQVVQIEPDWRNNLLAVITNPNIAYFLMLVGFYGIIFELSSPGNIYPGVIGAICLILALYAFQVLPINYAGLALIILGLAFMVGEAFMPSFGILGLGGIIAFVFGSIILMDDANLHISIPLIGGTALVSAGMMTWGITRLVRLRRRPSITGSEGLQGATAVALADFVAGEGRVRLLGESWRASANVEVHEGQTLRVTGVRGLSVDVEPVGDGPRAASKGDSK